jgi:signal transduction histidine kinase
MVYATGLIFLVIHSLNLISLTIVYEGWTIQQNVTVFAIIVIAAITLMLRVTKSPIFYGSAYAFLTLIGVFIASAIPSTPGSPPNGISSSLIPILCSSAAFIAFVGTRAISILYIILAAALIGGLYLITASYGALSGAEGAIAWQRAVQGWMSLFLIGPICMITSHMVFRNLDSLEVAVDRAQCAERDRADFMATMSHEIRTPLHGILGLSDILSKAQLGPTQKRQAELISVSANNLMEIIDEILDMARLEDGTVRSHSEPFSPRTLLGYISDLFSVKAAQKSLWIGSDVSEDIPDMLIGDAPHLRQVLSNLVSNSLKFTQVGGVRLGARLVALEQDIAHVQFYVQDSGVGIPKEDQQAVFERFKQTESAKTSTTKGTGLGLTICRQLTDMMGGTLELQSSEGEGTVFYFTLALPVNKRANTDVIAA